MSRQLPESTGVGLFRIVIEEVKLDRSDAVCFRCGEPIGLRAKVCIKCLRRTTAGEFTRAYVEEHGYTLEQLDDMGIVAIPCDCGEEGCRGWQMTQQRVAPS